MIHPEFTPQHSSTPREFLVARDSRITNDGHDGIDFDKFKFDTPTGDAFMSEIRHRVTQHQVATGGTPDQHQCVIDVRDVMCSVLRTQGFRALPDFIATLHPVFPAGDMQRQDDLVLTTEERLGVLARSLQQGVGTGAVPVGTDQPGWTWSPGLATHERQSVLNEGQQQRASGGGGIPYPSAGFAVGTVYNPPGPGYNSYGATYNTNGQVTNHQSPSLPPPPPPPARQPPPDHPPPPGPQPPPPPAVAVYNTTGQVVNVGQPSTGPALRTLTLADGMVINGDVGPHVRLAASVLAAHWVQQGHGVQ